MTPTPVRLCVVGSANIDLTFRTGRLPRPGETLTGQSFQQGFGGKGANQAVMAARMGARVSLVARVGRDAFGEQSLRHYRAIGIDTTHLSVDDSHSSGTAAILVDDEARNCILVVPGANHGLTPADVRQAAAAIESSAAVLCQLEVPIATTLEAFRIARAAGVRTILNPAPAAALPDELLRLTDLCVPNEPEIELLTGKPAGNLEQVTAAAQVLRERGPRMVIVTLGSRGVLLLGDQMLHVPALSVRALDTSGAGDAFIGSLAVLLAEQQPLAEALRWANAAAAVSVTRPGTQGSFPERAEVFAFLSSLPGSLR
jgi:ribokinase